MLYTELQTKLHMQALHHNFITEKVTKYTEAFTSAHSFYVHNLRVTIVSTCINAINNSNCTIIQFHHSLQSWNTMKTCFFKQPTHCIAPRRNTIPIIWYLKFWNIFLAPHTKSRCTILVKDSEWKNYHGKHVTRNNYHKWRSKILF